MVKRRRRGHIQLRSNGTFRAYVFAGRDPITKKKRYLSETVQTYDQAEKALTRLLGQVDPERSPTTSGTLGYLLSRWLEVADLELTTRDGYEGYIRRNILPTLGDVPLRKLDTETLDRFYARLRAHGRRCRVCWERIGWGLAPLRAGERYRPKPDADEVTHELDCAQGLPMAPSSVRQVHAILRRALSQGVKWGWLPTNPAALASPPKVLQPDVQPPSPEEVAKLINAAWAADPDFGTLLWVAMTTGARRGELCALRWSQVRFEEGDLLIASNYVVRRGGRKVKDTKTHQSRRIAMDEATSVILADHLDRCHLRAAVYGCKLDPDGYVFSLDPDGRSPRLPDSVTRRMTRLAHRLGMPGRHLHEFRHYSATQLLAGGVDLRTVAGRLGHGGGGAVTLRVYASFVAAADRRAADLLGRSLPRPDHPAHPSVDDREIGE
jgi:integrase